MIKLLQIIIDGGLVGLLYGLESTIADEISLGRLRVVLEPYAPAVPGLFLAGDWIDTGLPATIESAVRSGHRAVDAALAPAPRDRR